MEQGNETILFVDDEDYLAEVGKEMLEDYGYVVDIETDPLAAMETFKQNPDRYDLLITDYTMPGMTGDELVAQLHAITPGLPVILCSGIRLTPEITEKTKLSRVLLKPFDMDVLLETVRSVLDDAAS
ncbi:MAG TPA: hypothetical protein DHV36_18360 [Desulfobacteraceae bacterium]|nr:hypothetical protein [Desulfobacteraceae bacterium]|tara:strand:+ start:3489 stop:3869 length:381 start_codon:yes stop_codon:yes gene_type:complete